jgi:hypothetical protein
MELNVSDTYPIIRKGKIMNHTSEGRNKPHRLRDLSFGVYNVVAHIGRTVPFCFVAHSNHVFRDGVELRVSAESQALHLTVEVPGPVGFECIWIHGVRGAIFFASQQHAIVVNDIGIRSSSNSEFDSVGIFIAVPACEGAPRGPLLLELLRVDISLLEVHMAILDAESADDAVSVKPLEHKRYCEYTIRNQVRQNTDANQSLASRCERDE